MNRNLIFICLALAQSILQENYFIENKKFLIFQSSITHTLLREVH